MVSQSWQQEAREWLTLKRVPSRLKSSLSFLATLGHDIKQTNLMLHASSMAYMTLGSIVPLLALTFAIISAFQPIAVHDATWFATFKTFILENLAPRSGEMMVQFLETFLANLDVAKIGLTGFLTLIVLIIILLRDIEMALNSVWQVPHTRPFLKRFLFFWITTTLGTLCVSVVVAAFSQFSVFGGFSYQSLAEQTRLESALSYLVNLGTTFIFFTVLHKIGPNCQVSFKAALVGGLTATIMIRIASAGFGFYSTHSKWNESIYEALAVVPLFLLWLYLAWFVILFSAIIAWRTHHGFNVQRARETLQERPLEEERTLLRDHHLRSLLPFFCVMLAGQRFLEAKGQGLNGKEMAAELNLPPYWIRESLLIAEEHGLLLIKRPAENKNDAGNDVLELMAYPSFPLDRMTLAQLVAKLTGDTAQWLRACPKDLPFPLPELLSRAYESLQLKQGQVSLASLLEGGHAG